MNVSSPGGSSYHFSSSYGAGKAGLNRLSADMALELKHKGIACGSIYRSWSKAVLSKLLDTIGH